MNNPSGYDISKKYDLALVNWLIGNGIQARLATEEEDQNEKWDILIEDTLNVDTKYPPQIHLNRKTKKSEIWFEYTKICGTAYRKVDQLWYFIQGNQKIQLFFKKNEIVEFLASQYDKGKIVLKESNTCKNKGEPDSICYVPIDDLKEISFVHSPNEWVNWYKNLRS